MATIGIIGGSGLDDPDILQNPRDEEISTPYGAPSSPLKKGTINGVDVIILARHGREHTLPPHKVNYRANINALKQAGCTHILATTAVGSLREEIKPGHFVVLDQFIDWTFMRKSSFIDSFEPHNANHPAMPDPYNESMRQTIIAECKAIGLQFHEKGTVITEEGPRFSTRAESRMFRILGADVVNMSIATETALANEAGIPYAAIAMATDYDSWRTDEAAVTNDMVLKIFAENAAKMTTLLTRVIPKIK
jgi:5'-methylthioadenosine phosphorylase